MNSLYRRPNQTQNQTKAAPCGQRPFCSQRAQKARMCGNRWWPVGGQASQMPLRTQLGTLRLQVCAWKAWGPGSPERAVEETKTRAFLPTLQEQITPLPGPLSPGSQGAEEDKTPAEYHLAEPAGQSPDHSFVLQDSRKVQASLTYEHGCRKSKSEC